jgi:serine/threonine protein kinase
MAQPTWIGRSLVGRYQIEALLGQGGMSAVYKATDPNLKRVVAIKLIHSHLSADQSFIQRFEEEAAAVASLRHPNIVQVYDYNSDEGTHFMVLEFVAGETLQDRLQHLNAQGRKLEIKEAIKYILNICDALGYAHQRGMIHRDIKPANIMLDVYGQAILMDFGIVKILGGTSHTATGAVLGTARYISPEVIRSEQADQRSDIYSLGVMIYEMLSGQPPFRADTTMSLMMSHLNDPVPDPRTMRADLPVELVNIMLKCLEKDRANRYQNVGELAADLKSVLANPVNQTAAAPALFAPVSQPVKIANPALPAINKNAPGEQNRFNPAEKIVNQSTEIDRSGMAMAASGSLPQYNQYNQSAVIQPPVKKSNTLIWMLGLGGGFFFFIILLVIAGIFLMSRQFAGPVQPGATSPSVGQKSTALIPTSVPAVIATGSSATQPVIISSTSTPVLEATATYPPYYVRINSIKRDGNKFSVQYETFGFVEKLPFMHIHFFFNNVPPDQAGMPGMGPWKLYGGPRPFTGYAINQKPDTATQICALVANANHTVIANSGNCMDLP